MAGRAQLCVATGKSDRTILLWLQKNKVPTAYDAYRLAKAIGASRTEALTLARECFPDSKDAAS